RSGYRSTRRPGSRTLLGRTCYSRTGENTAEGPLRLVQQLETFARSYHCNSLLDTSTRIRPELSHHAVYSRRSPRPFFWRGERVPAGGQPQLRSGIGEIGVGLDPGNIRTVGVSLSLQQV